MFEQTISTAIDFYSESSYKSMILVLQSPAVTYSFSHKYGYKQYVYKWKSSFAKKFTYTVC